MASSRDLLVILMALRSAAYDVGRVEVGGTGFLQRRRASSAPSDKASASQRAERGQILGTRASDQNARRDRCPDEYTVLRDDSGPSAVRLNTVRTFTKDYPDPWWTQSKVERFHGNASEQLSYRIGPSQISDCGVFATRFIPANSKIDRVWAPDDTSWMPSLLQSYVIHVTPWFGYGMNHCTGDKTNVHVEKGSDGTMWGVATRDIPFQEELLVDYNKVFWQYPFRIMPASPFWKC